MVYWDKSSKFLFMDKKVVLVHDFLVTRGGAERVLRELCDMFPDAPVYTLLYDETAMGDMFSDRVIRTSLLQRFPKFLRRRYRWLLPFFSPSVEAFDLREYDVVISSSGAWSKGIVTKLKTKHLAYIHSPMRYVWDYNERYLRPRWGFSVCRRIILSYLRVWDRMAADRPDALVANSEYTRRRIEKYYRRDAGVVYPPVTLGEHTDPEALLDETLRAKEYFLVVSRLTQSKNVSIVIEAFQKLHFPLLIIGEGYDESSIRKYEASRVEFLGRKSDGEVARYMANAQALIFPSEDDFGMTAVEALQMGTPVIALKKGGALETVEENVTGIFFSAPVSVAVADGIRRFLEHGSWDKKYIRERGLQFSRERFRKGILAEIEKMG